MSNIVTLDDERCAEILLSLHRNLLNGHITCEVIEGEKFDGDNDLSKITFTFLGKLNLLRNARPWRKV